MRPLALTVEAFGPFVAPQRLDLEALESAGLVLIEGPNGAGKTTLFDAMAYALFGAVPGVREAHEGHLRSQHPLAAERATRVALTFEVPAGRHRVERSPAYARKKKKGEGTTTEPAQAVLYRIAPDGKESVVTSRAQEVTERVTRLIGLTREQFGQILVLPQGEFRRFLLSGSGEKEALLTKLFGTGRYERAGTLLAERAKLAEERIGERRRQQERLLAEAEVSDAAALRARVDAAATETAALRKTAAVTRAAWEAQQRANVARAELRTALVQREAARVGAERRAKEAAENLARAREAHQAMERQLAAQGDPAPEMLALREERAGLAERKRRIDQRTRLVVERDRARAAVLRGEKERSELLEQHKRAKERVQELVDRRAASAAASLARGLSSGSPCPVCGSEAHPSPAAHVGAVDPAELARAEAALSEILAKGQRVGEALARARGDQENAEKQLQELDVASESAEALAERERHIAARLGALETAAEKLAVGQKRSSEALARAEAQHAETVRALEEAGTSEAAARAAWRGAFGEESPQAGEQAEAKLRALSDQLRSQDKALHDREHRAELDARRLAALEGLSAELAEAQERAGALVLLADVVRGKSPSNPRKITLGRYVLQSFMAEVLRAANHRLLRMSQGRYRLGLREEDVDRRQMAGLDLMVIDRASGETRRPVATLSGGEMFLASLALALGLADVAEAHAGGVRMEVLFIDEGFGNLDDESLDVALRALTELRASGRLVGVISHVAALKERIPTHIMVRPGPTGSTVRVRGRSTDDHAIALGGSGDTAVS